MDYKRQNGRNQEKRSFLRRIGGKGKKLSKSLKIMDLDNSWPVWMSIANQFPVLRPAIRLFCFQ